jgi:hypothetical protein
VEATGLSADPTQYRARLDDEEDEQIGRWTAELMRDVAIRRGVVKVVAEFRAAARISEAEFERVFTRGGGSPSVIGRDAQGRLMVPAISLHHLVGGLRDLAADWKARLIDYLVKNFDEIVFV